MLLVVLDTLGYFLVTFKVVSNVCSENGVVLHDDGNPPLLHIHRNNGSFRPTTALQMPKVGVPASPWMWAKARSKLGALLIRPCGDGVVSNVCSENGVVFCMKR
jgi:hypothetical protein